MGKHKSIKRTVAILKRKGAFHERRTSRYLDLDRYDIYCKCGYIGSGEMTTHESLYGGEVITTKAKCPKCNANPDVELFHNNYMTVSRTDLTKIWDNGEKISIHFCYTSYFYNFDVDKIAAKKNRIALTFNANTGIMYFMKNKGLVNWTFVSDRHKMKNKAHEFFDLLEEDKKTKEQMKTFLKMCIERRGIKYYDFEPQFSATNYDCAEGLRNIFAILRYPVLQDMNNKERVVRYAIPQKGRKALVSCENITEVYKKVFGLKTKKGIKIFKDERYNALISTFSNVLETEGGFDYFCDMWLDEYEKYKDRRFRMRNSLISEVEMYAYMDFNHSIMNKKNLVHLRQSNKKKYDELDISERLFLGLKLIRSFYKTDSAFVRKMFNSKKREKKERKVKVGKYKLNKKWTKTTNVPIESLLTIIEDVYRMYAKIKHYLPNVEVGYTGDIVHYHDMLMKTERRIKLKSEKVSYSQQELEYYDKEVNGLTISLAKTTNELVESGTKMNICVPSYASSVIKKELYILFVYENDAAKACIELSITNRGTFVAQVKGYSNREVEFHIAKELATYFNERNLPFGDCVDMSDYEGIENSEAPKRNKKLLPKVEPRGEPELTDEELEVEGRVIEQELYYDEAPF